jgi:hypothetical protein
MAESHPTTSVEFRTIDRLPGYKFGADGTVYSCWGQIANWRCRGTRSVLTDKWKLIRGHFNRDGYRVASLKVEGGRLRGGREMFLLHRLTLEAFVGPCHPGMLARHLDGNPANCSIANLRWGTDQENVDDMARHGTKVVGSRHPFAKITEADVLVIREAARSGEKLKWIALRYGMRVSAISRIVKGVRWGHVPINVQ